VASDIYLFDTNAIIEAVDIGWWNALSGGLVIETVAEVVEECRRGDQLRSGYVAVDDANLARLHRIHSVPDEGRAEIELLPKADAIHAGEKDLFWYAMYHVGDFNWVCSPDRGSVQFAIEHHLGDSLVSLEAALKKVGHAPKLRPHFSERWLSIERARALLDP